MRRKRARTLSLNANDRRRQRLSKPSTCNETSPTRTTIDNPLIHKFSQVSSSSSSNNPTIISNSPLVSPHSSPIAKKRLVSHGMSTYDNSSTESEVEYHAESDDTVVLIKEALDHLKKDGLDIVLLNFFKLVNNQKFPLTNIAFLLFTDVVSWYSLETTSEMRYSKDSKLFWKLGYRLFGGRFMHFMGGFKNESQIVENPNKKGLLLPTESEINFVVPSFSVLRNFDPYTLRTCGGDNGPTQPGIFTDMMKSLANELNGRSCCLTFDGKKLKQGLTPTSGDVDLMGFEKHGSLVDKREQLKCLTEPLKQVNYTLEGIDGTLSDLDNMLELKDMLLGSIKNVSKQVFDVKDIRKKKDYAKQKLIENCGQSDWKNSKYVMGISAMIAYIYDIDEYLALASGVLSETVNCLASLNGIPTRKETELNLHQCDSYIGLKECITGTELDTRKIRQRTDTWHNRRKLAKVTGSTLYNAIGLDGLKRQREHFENVICGIEKNTVSETVAELFKYGTDNEPNAAATVVEKVLPVLFPKCVLYEEGFIEIDATDGKPFMIVSPDGSIGSDNDNSKPDIAVELKCPMMDLHKTLPNRYLLQCLSEIEALDVQSLVYLCWKPDFSSVFIVHRNTELFNRAYKLAETLLKAESPKRQTRQSPETKALKREIDTLCKSTDSVEFVGMFPSVKHSMGVISNPEMTIYTSSRVQYLITQIIKVFESYHEVTREKATEAVVFLCSDLERNTRSVATAPMCWFTKGNSLDCQTMRNTLEHVMNTCKESGLYVPAVSFDGQWHLIAVTDENNRPLTKLQLQKQVWRETEQMSKSAILAAIKTLNGNAQWKRDQNGDIVVYMKAGSRVPTISDSITKNRLKKLDVSYETQNDAETENSDKHKEDAADEITFNKEQQMSAILNIDKEKASVILIMLKTDQNCNKKGTWSNKTVDDVIEYTQTVDKLKTLREVDLRMVTRYLKRQGYINLKESGPKQVKVRQITKVLGLESDDGVDLRLAIGRRRISKDRDVKSLKDLAFHEFSKFRKPDLNIIYSEYIWPQKLSDWQKRAYLWKTNLYQNQENDCDDVNDAETLNLSCEELPKGDMNIQCEASSKDDTVPCKCIHSDQIKQPVLKTSGATSDFTELFYIPAYSSRRQQYEVSCVDSSHLLTRMRRKCCKGGLDGCSNNAWRAVAKSSKTSLTLAMVDCVLDQMSVPIAVSHFSKAVEDEMKLCGYRHEAKLCRDIRSWWEAEDKPGIPARTRLQMRMSLRERLLGYVDFGAFPPPGMYVNGWPTQLWEAVISNIDAKTLLYTLATGKRYNTRAFSSLVGETFFSELTLYDRRGQGTVTSSEFGQFLGTTIEKLYMRLDPGRKFVYRTCRKTAYNLMDASENIESISGNEDSDISMRDQHFDTKDRARVRGRKKFESMASDRNAVLRGSLGVRWEKARRNESKLLPTIRMGIEDTDTI